MTIAIHQPNFCPYNGFFQKVSMCDVFVILRHCQFEKNNYQNRFNDGIYWNTMRVTKKTEKIVDKSYISPIEDWAKIVNRHKHLATFDDCIRTGLADTNINIILKTLNIMGIKTKIVYDYPTELKSTERLIDLIKTYKGTEYLSGPSGQKYMNLDLFKDNNIKLRYQTNIINKPFNELI